MNLHRVAACMCIPGLLLLAGCGGDGGGSGEVFSPPADPDQLLTSETIGTSGGTIAAEELTVTVPAGAFGSAQELKLYRSGDEDPFGSAAASPLYRLSGLPAVINQPLQVEFPVTGKDGALHIAMGETNFSPSIGGLATGYRILTTTATDSTVVAVIPAAPDAAAGDDAGMSVMFINLADYTGKSATPGYGTLTSASEHFQISYPVGYAVQAANLGGYLESAYDIIHGWGFSYTARTNWPVQVTICDLGEQYFGYQVPSMWGDNYGTILFNTRHIGETTEIKVTAGHEFFHLVQNLYDNRNRFSKSKSPSDRYWLDEAVSIWGERTFIGDPSYTSGTVRMSREMMPFDRFHVGEYGSHPGWHGYGMAAFIAFLHAETTNASLAAVYDYIWVHGNNPVAAVKSVFADPYVVWHPQFLRELIQGDLYDDVALANALSSLSGTWTITSSGSQQKMYSTSYNDGQARFYKIEPRATDFDPQARLHMELADDADGRINVYRYHGSTLTYLGSADNQYDIDHLDGYFTSGDNILVMVTNSHLEGDYDAVNNMTLTLKLQEPSGFREGRIWINGPATMILHKTNTTGLDTTYTVIGRVAQFDGALYLSPVAGSSVGLTFTATYDSVVVEENLHKSGTLTVTVDNEDNPTIVTSFSLSATEVYPHSGPPERTTTYTITGSGVPAAYSYQVDDYSFTLEDAAAEPAIDSAEYSEVSALYGTTEEYTLTEFAADFILIRLVR